MAVSSVHARPLGIVGVVLLTVIYSGSQLVTNVFGWHEPFWVFGAGVAGLAVAFLLWQQLLVGWIAAVVLYTLLLLELALRAAVFGLAQVPHIVIVFAALAFLLRAHDRFQIITKSDATEPSPDRINCPACGARNTVTNEACSYCDEPL